MRGDAKSTAGRGRDLNPDPPGPCRHGGGNNDDIPYSFRTGNRSCAFIGTAEWRIEGFAEKSKFLNEQPHDKCEIVRMAGPQNGGRSAVSVSAHRVDRRRMHCPVGCYVSKYSRIQSLSLATWILGLMLITYQWAMYFNSQFCAIRGVTGGAANLASPANFQNVSAQNEAECGNFAAVLPSSSLFMLPFIMGTL